MASSSSSQLHHIDNVDDSYFSALHDYDETFPISDEKYAEELQLQEALVSSSLSLKPSPNQSTSTVHSCASSSKQPLVFTTSETTQSMSDFCMDAKTTMFQNTKPEATQSVCAICLEPKTASEMFKNTKVCGHHFCTNCVREYVAAKIKENVTMVKCPDLNCKEVIGPQDCESIVPKEVLERWESILCESLIMGSEKFYCPFKDCSAMMVDDGGEAVTVSECPSCNRLFCAQCKVAWHCGMSCGEFESWKKGESNREDNLLMDLAKNKNWMRCSKCKFFVEKVDGCKHISCRCGHEFCYGCGSAYTNTHVCASV
ncbi:putative transcription factor C2H2 family [Helianthus debilis subsp. tardiflorus]